MLFQIRPPAQLNEAEGEATRRSHNIIIAFGGPLTHVVHMIIYGGLIYLYCGHNSYVVKDDVTYDIYSCPNGVIPFSNLSFWQGMIMYYKGTDGLNSDGIFFVYDFLMLAFTTNFWMFVINLLIPIYPLDGSKIFLNCLLGICSKRTTAKCYCCVNGIIAVISIIIGAAFFMNQFMLLFIGIWGFSHVKRMGKMIAQHQENTHPMFNESNGNIDSNDNLKDNNAEGNNDNKALIVNINVNEINNE